MEKVEIKLSVIKVVQSIGTFYIASISARDLVQISYADVRRIGERDIERYLGIQRPLEKKRVQQIKKYLKSPDASFPTGIVLSVDQKCAEFDSGGFLTLKAFQSAFDDDESIPLNKVAKILDGQHRIAAFIGDDSNFDESLFATIGGEFEFNANIFVGIDVDEQANIFATVNLAQTKVNRSLAYDLEGLSKTRSPFRTCHVIAVTLDSADSRSPLYQRVKRLGVKTKGREFAEPLTQAAFVESLVKLISPDPFEDRIVYLKGDELEPASAMELQKFPFRNLFINKQDNDIALIIFNYFSAVKQTWPKAWDGINVEGNVLPRNNAFKAFMRFLRRCYVEMVSLDRIGRVPSIEEFAQVLRKIDAVDDDFATGTFKPGSAGEADMYRLFIGETTIQRLRAQ